MKHSLRFGGAFVCLLWLASAAHAQTGGVRGSVKDPSGAVIAGARVVLITQGTGSQRLTESGRDGSFEFVAVPVAVYTVEVESTGFKKFVQKDMAVDIGHVVVVNAAMELGQSSTTVTVEASGVQVETTSTQLGAVVNERAITELPLNARDVYQLLQIQPGVQSQVGIDLFYGSDKAGVVSVNGGRGRSNNYSVNGGEGNDMFANLPAIQPSPDSIDEFRVLTNTFDAEYGRNSGAVVNVVTKSGTNDWHGDVYEFFRNKVLNAKGFLDAFKADSKQNQYGGTFGGPIKKDKTFFFASYEGRRAIKGISSQQISLPSPAELAGDFSSVAGATPTFGGTISPTIANILETRRGGACRGALPAAAQAALDSAAPPPTGTASLVTYDMIFPGAVIPTACFDPLALNLLQYVPSSGNLPGNVFQAVPNSINNEDQFSVRLDHHLTSTQTLSAYYFFEHDHNLDPFARFQAAGANLGTFPGLTDQLVQQFNVSHTWTIGTSAVNEVRFTYFREGQGQFNHPTRTGLVSDSCPASGSFASAAAICFTGTTDAPLVNSAGNCLSSGAPPPCPPNPRFGITPGGPGVGAAQEGVPNVVVNGGFSIGNNFEGELPQVGNTFQWSDTYSKVIGKHSMKFGGDVRYQKFDQTLYFSIAGQLVFGNTGKGNSLCAATVTTPGSPPNPAVCSALGDSYANYLLGLADSFLQGSAQQERVRSTSVYLFGQDSWKIKPNLTLNYGLRWEVNTPLTDIGKKVETFRAGQSSTIFPCTVSPSTQAFLGVTSPDCNAAGVTPVGEVFPGDKGISNGLTQTYYKSFGPRIGLAWSPGWSEGWLKSLTGGPGKTSIRMGYGMFYNPVEQLVLEQFSAEPPFGVSPFLSNVLLQSPYVSQAGVVSLNGAAGILNPLRGTAQDFARFEPILLFGEAPPNVRSQYSEQYNLTIQREFPGSVLFQIGYVGSQGHRLLASYDLNPGNVQTCLDLNQIRGPGTCAATFEDSTLFQIPAGTVLPVALHLPYAPPGMPLVIPAGTTIGPNGINFIGTRPFSAPLCNPYGAFPGNGCPSDGISVFANIFTQNNIANSNYNSFQMLVEKKYSHGLQLQAAYTFSKSIDNASSFEQALDPLDFHRSRALSLFDARNRFVLSYYWQFPVPKYQGFKGKLLDGWASSGIATFQDGFPIRIVANTSDNERFGSFDFEAPGEPNLVGSFRTQNPRNGGCALGTGPTSPRPVPGALAGSPPCRPISNLVFDPNLFNNTAFDPSTGGTQLPGTVTLGTIGNAPRSICCGPGINNFDISILKTTSISERVKTEFRAEFFNIFNHAQFIGVQGDITQNANAGAPFGKVLRARDPRLIQFGLKFIF